jgi:glycosyltransferase involved in cell wall biosynthesis
MVFLIVAGFPDSLILFRKSLIISLLDEGFDVHVAAPQLKNNVSVASKLIELGVSVHDVPIHRVGKNPLLDIISFLYLLRLIHKIGPKYILGYTAKPVIYGSIAAWLARVPNRFSLITGLGFAFIGEEGGGRNRLKFLVQALYRFSLNKNKSVFFQNPDDESLFRSLGVIHPSTTSLVVNGSGVDILQFEVTPVPLNYRPNFLLIGRLLGDKGIREYVQSAKKIKQRYPEVDFNLVGWIDNNPNAITLAELNKWVEAGTINYLGRLNDVRPAIQDCSVYVLPSYREGTPRTVLEAMAMGRAIITTDAPGCRETVVDGDNGFLVPIKNVDALAAAMLRFIEQPELVTQMGQRSREIAEEKYDVHKVNAVMLREMGITQ